ncbi:MAG: glycosyltransferase [Nanoarchaeota archaeon]
MPELSIVIPTLNEEKYLPKLLNSIKKQTYKDYEIIVADAGSKDNTKKIAKKYGCKIVKGGMPSVGRNAGAKIAKGTLLLFLDADVILPKDFFKKAINEFKNKSLDIATTYFYPLSNYSIDRKMYKFANEFMKSVQYIRPVAPGWCILIKKRLHNKIKGFNKKITFAEDHDYVWRASKFGKFKILKIPKIYVSVRRLKKEGRKNLAIKYIKATFLILLGKKPSAEQMNYEMDYKKC